MGRGIREEGREGGMMEVGGEVNEPPSVLN